MCTYPDKEDSLNYIKIDRRNSDYDDTYDDYEEDDDEFTSGYSRMSFYDSDPYYD